MTFIGYPNLSAVSESGRYRIEVVGEEIENYFRDRKNFAYRLYDGDRLLWEIPTERTQEPIAFLDDYPHEAWVDDHGWVVVRTHEWFHAGLFVISPTGAIVLRSAIQSYSKEDAPGFLDDEPEEHLGSSSAGPFWSKCALAYFDEHDGSLSWTIRTWWGRRVAIDLRQARFVEPSQVDERRADELERCLIQRMLAADVAAFERKDPASDDRHFQQVDRIRTAAYQAGRLQAVEAIPWLRRLETSRYIGSHGYGPIEWGVLITLDLRQFAKLSLLRLNQEPRWRSHYRIECRKQAADDANIEFEFPEQAVDRRPDAFAIGQTQQEVLRRLSAPDFVQRNSWDYDFVAPDVTVRLCWSETDNEKPRIERIERLEPQWKQITKRDLWLT